MAGKKEQGLAPAIEGEVVEEVAQPSLDALTRAEVDMQIATAKRYPRNLKRVKQAMKDLATLDEETAAACFYSLKRKDAEGNQKIIQGESIRLAEIALSCYQNVRAGTRTAGETEDGRFVREIGMCHDLENNVLVLREAKRRITTREGKRYGDDMVGTTMAAAGAIALRNAILTVIPRALVKPAYEAAKAVAAGKTKSLIVRRSEILARLTKLSPLITTERVLLAVGKPSLDEVGWPEIEHLIGMGTAIKDGVQTVEEAFPSPGAAATAALNDFAASLAERAEQKKPAPTAEPRVATHQPQEAPPDLFTEREPGED